MATTDYGTDLPALDDLPETDALISGPLNAAYAVARRWLTPSGGLADAGDPAPYESFDVRSYLGRRLEAGTLAEIEQLAARCAKQDVRVQSITVTASISDGILSLRAQVFGAGGPFNFVLNVSAVSVAVLLEAA